MPLPRIIHRIWIGSMPTEEQIQILTEARQYVKDSVELWLWTTSSVVSRLPRNNLLTNNIVIRNIHSLWSHPLTRGLPVAQLHSVFERESRGAFNNYAAASDVARLMILYCYGGIYLDMDVLFKTSESCLFNDLTGIHGRLGVLQRPNGGIGNGVLASTPQSKVVKLCLEKLKELYCSGASGELSWGVKRGYGCMRMRLTVMMSGPQMIYDTTGTEQFYPIPESTYFEPIDARGLSYTQYSQLKRRDSVPHF